MTEATSSLTRAAGFKVFSVIVLLSSANGLMLMRGEPYFQCLNAQK
jgi:3,4-dihydroxy-2-butanone 4-phosphate synthase